MPAKKGPPKKPFKKVAEEPDSELYHDLSQPMKPKGEEETRLFQVILKGNHPDGKNVVHGTAKRWLTKAQAEELGFNWAPSPFLGKKKKYTDED